MHFPDIDLSKLSKILTYSQSEPLLFNSGLFLFLFLGFMFFYGFLYKHITVRVLYITVFSFYFYYKSSGWYFVLMAGVTVAAYFLTNLIFKTQSSKQRKALLILSLTLYLGVLGYFKYTNFLIEIVNSFLTDKIAFQNIFLPLGISFYTFELISYSIDVYQKKFEPVKNILDFGFYISFFPHLVAGPIVRPHELVPQIRKKLIIHNEFVGKGVFFITSGLIKKAIISDYIGINFVDRIFDNPTLYSGLENLIGVYGYTLQIYCDFSGYSDMAIGIACFMGFTLPLNFNAPYKSTNITEFWRRWHISLSSWLRDYLYIPLGGNRKGKIRQHCNLIITMLLGGLWHGASFKFIVWGGMHGIALALDKGREKLIQSNKASFKNHFLFRFAGWFFTFHLVALCWIFFRASDFQNALSVITQIGTNFQPKLWLQIVLGYKIVVIFMALGYLIHFTPQSFDNKLLDFITRLPLFFKALLLSLVIYLVYQTKSAEVQPFIYFQF